MHRRAVQLVVPRYRRDQQQLQRRQRPVPGRDEAEVHVGDAAVRVLALQPEPVPLLVPGQRGALPGGDAAHVHDVRGRGLQR